METPKYWIRTSDLLLHMDGVEVAAFPILYPRPSFGDTNLYKRQVLMEGAENSIVTSHMRKLLSSCTGYMLKPRLTFLINDIAMARRLTSAIKVSETRGFSAEVATDHYTDSEAYWRHEQNISCDMVRQMARWSEVPSTDPMGKKIYEFCNDPLGKKSMAFPNYFITIAPVEWLFPLPAWLDDLVANGRLSDVSGMVALHIYHVLLVALKEILQPGEWFDEVFHYCMRIEFQGRGTVHIHIALWAIAKAGLQLEGRNTGDYDTSPFVNFLSSLFGGCKVDVQLGSGWLNYINGYIDKASDAMDFRVKEHYKDEAANAAWRQTYRLMSKRAPLLTEVYLSMTKRPRMIRTFLTDVLCPIIPGKVDLDSYKATSHHRMYKAYLQLGADRHSADSSVAAPIPLGHGRQELSFLEFCRLHRWDDKTGKPKPRTYTNKQSKCRGHHCAVGVKFEFELYDNFIGQFATTFFRAQRRWISLYLSTEETSMVLLGVTWNTPSISSAY